MKHPNLKHQKNCQGPIDALIADVEERVSTTLEMLELQLTTPVTVAYVDPNGLTAWFRSLPDEAKLGVSPISLFTARVTYVPAVRTIVVRADLMCDWEQPGVEGFARSSPDEIPEGLFRHLLHTQFTCRQVEELMANFSRRRDVIRATLQALDEYDETSIESTLAELFGHWVGPEGDSSMWSYMTDCGQQTVGEFIRLQNLDPALLPPSYSGLLEVAEEVFGDFAERAEDDEDGKVAW
ncbi:MAG: hypothetical protein ACYC63_16670 [Armatimonadota bacterium]